MASNIYSVIAGTGSYIPTDTVKNEDFAGNVFYDPQGKIIDKPNEETIKKFEEITGINERKYVEDNLVASDIGYFAAEDALKSSGIDKESLDYIICAHNFGDVDFENRRSDFVPSLAARIKYKLGIENPETIAHDTPFGCPGWLQGVIQANYYIKSGDIKKVLIIGTETLSRISDFHDRDSMIYADGAGAVVFEAIKSETPVGILSHAIRSDTKKHANLLRMEKSCNPNYDNDELFLKMDGHTLYKYALQHVPGVIKKSLDRAGLTLDDIKKAFIHQANERMDDDILKRLYGLYGKKENEIPKDVMPMTISWLGNSSVATIPTLLDLFFKGKLDGNHRNLEVGNVVVLASVGAGMNINSVVYRLHETPKYC